MLGRYTTPPKRETRDGLVSHPLEEAVPSALQRFTARFGMGLGGAVALWSRISAFTSFRPHRLVSSSSCFLRVLALARPVVRFASPLLAPEQRAEALADVATNPRP